MEPDAALPSLHGAYRELDLNLSVDSLEDHDTDSLSEEREYQSQLQDWICHNDEVVFQTTDGGKDGDAGAVQGVMEIGDTEITSHQETRTGQFNSRSPDTHSTYSELRYDPDWRSHQNLLNKSPQDEEDLSDVSSSFSDHLSPDETILNTSPERGGIITVHQNHKPFSYGLSRPKKIPTRTKPVYSKGVRNRTRSDEDHQNTTTGDKVAHLAQQEAAKKDFIEKNKATLGVRTQKPHSYLHIHKKKTDESQSDQNNGKSDVMPVKNVSHQVKEIKHNGPLIPGTIEEAIFPGSQIKETVLNNINLTSPLSDINVSRQNKMGSSTRQLTNEYLPTASYSDKYLYSNGGSKDIYLSPEDPQIQNKVFFHHQITPQEFKHNRKMIENLGAPQDTLDKRLSQIEVQTLQEASVSSPANYNTDNYIFLPDLIIQLKNEPQPNSDPRTGTDPSLYEKSKGGDTLSQSGVNQEPMRPKKQMEEKHQKMLISYLREKVKLGGIGPTYTISQEKKEQLRQQKEYAKQIQERNRNAPMKAREIHLVQSDENKGTRQKSLEYAMKVPRPQPLPKASSDNRTEVKERRMSYDSLFPPIKLLEDLKVRHEREKMAVAALSALHIK